MVVLNSSLALAGFLAAVWFMTMDEIRGRCKQDKHLCLPLRDDCLIVGAGHLLRDVSSPLTSHCLIL